MVLRRPPTAARGTVHHGQLAPAAVVRHRRPFDLDHCHRGRPTLGGRPLPLGPRLRAHVGGLYYIDLFRYKNKVLLGRNVRKNKKRVTKITPKKMKNGPEQPPRTAMPRPRAVRGQAPAKRPKPHHNLPQDSPGRVRPGPRRHTPGAKGGKHPAATAATTINPDTPQGKPPHHTTRRRAGTYWYIYPARGLTTPGRAPCRASTEECKRAGQSVNGRSDTTDRHQIDDPVRGKRIPNVDMSTVVVCTHVHMSWSRWCVLMVRHHHAVDHGARTAVRADDAVLLRSLVERCRGEAVHVAQCW